MQQEFIRFILLVLVSLFVLFSLVQCRSVFTETTNRHKRSLSNINCMFRKNPFCDYLRAMETEKYDQTGNDQELWKRGVSQFYSNW